MPIKFITPQAADAVAPASAGPTAAAPLVAGIDNPSAGGPIDSRLAIGGAVVALAFAWAYWTTFAGLISAWNTQADYSHGYLVLPLAAYFLWSRRDSFPGFWSAGSREATGRILLGTALLSLSVFARFSSAWLYIDAFDQLSILLWCAGMAVMLGGWPLLRWSGPSIVFLMFMMPLPYRFERSLSMELQKIATGISCWLLQSLGQPAFPEGNVIVLGSFHFEVEEACSGLRIFVGIAALAYAYVALIRRSWVEKGLLILSVVPVALAANAMRIVAIALLNQYVSSEASKRFSHDLSGFVMIPVAAGMFGLIVLYLRKLLPEESYMDVRNVLRRGAGGDRR